ATPVLQGLTMPILNQVQPEPARLHRKPGQTLKLDGLTPVLQGTLANSADWQTVPLPAPATGRYLTLEALNSYSNDAFASLAELYVQDADGHDLPRAAWKVVYADSEEMASEDGSADNVFDLQSTTYWHTRWSGDKPPPHPHQLVIDLGRDVTISGLRFLQRPGATTIPARIKDFRIFLTPTLPPGL
ncbi:MAG: discoidin domain-containing protein, partial [Armatimonadota bacterium]|nr:discoidin domain-containing protein [Armatimonadota bacterium]